MIAFLLHIYRIALTLADLDLGEGEIEMLMTTMAKAIQGDTALMHIAGSRFFSFSGGISVGFSW